MKRTLLRLVLAAFAVPALVVSGCSRPQRTQEQVAGPSAPYNLQRGPLPAGGQSMSPTAAGAGGSSAGGAQNVIGRVGGIAEAAVVDAPHGDEINVDQGHRMSPTTDNAASNGNSDGSGTGDTGNSIPPSVSLATPPPKGAKPEFAPASNEPPRRGPASKPQPTSAFGAAHSPADSLPGQ